MLIAEMVFVFFVSKSAFLWSKKQVLKIFDYVKEQVKFIKTELLSYKKNIMKLLDMVGVSVKEISSNGVKFILKMTIPASLVIVIFCCTKNYRLQEIKEQSKELDRLNLEIVIRKKQLVHIKDSLNVVEIENMKASFDSLQINHNNDEL